MKSINPKQIILFLIDKFNEINVSTHENDWEHIKDYEVNDDLWERKFFHPNLGYMEVTQSGEKLLYKIKILEVFRYVTKGDDLELVKKLFAALMTNNDNPNVQAYYEDSQHNLTNASRNGNLDIIKFLVKNGVHIHVENEVNIIAALNNHKYQVVEYFLETDPNINLEVVLNDRYIDENMARFIKNWQLLKELNTEVSTKDKAETKLKI